MTLLFQKKVVTVCHRMLQTILERLLIGSESLARPKRRRDKKKRCGPLFGD